MSTIPLLADWTADMWGPIINLFSFIPSYGWMIIVFTICLKLVLSPLDFWQRKVTRNMTVKQQRLQPEMEKLRKRYGNNAQLLNQKTMELYKKENFNMFGSCFSMLINLVITIFIFMTLFYGLMGISQQQILKQYDNLKQTYNTEFAVEYGIDPSAENLQELVKEKENDLLADAYEQAKTEDPTGTEESWRARQNEIFNGEIEKFQQKVLEQYNVIKESWLWVGNLWRPDTMASGFANYNDFVGLSQIYNSPEYKASIEGKTEEEIEQIKKDMQIQYDRVTAKVQTTYSSWNGYFILVVLAAVVTFLSATISQKMSMKKRNKQEQIMQQAPKAGNIMKFILPIIMVLFTIGYSAAFALYIVTNSLMSLLLSIVFLKIIEVNDDKKQVEIQQSKSPSYSRYNTIEEPTTVEVKKTKKAKFKKMEYQRQFRQPDYSRYKNTTDRK